MVSENGESVAKIIMKAAIEENVAKVASIKRRINGWRSWQAKSEMAIMAIGGGSMLRHSQHKKKKTQK
jgi:hypothetical protein